MTEFRWLLGWILYTFAIYGGMMFAIQVAWWFGVRYFLGMPLR